MRSAMAAVSRAGRTSWTRRMWAPARMAAVFATAVGSVVGEADPSAALHPSEPGPLAGDPGLRDDNEGALRDDFWPDFFASHPSPDAAKDGAPGFCDGIGDAGPSTPLRSARDDRFVGGWVMRSHLLTTMMTERPDSWA